MPSMIERIAKLLNKAEHAANEHEAAVYFEKAQALATAHAISLARARLLTAGATTPTAPVQRTITIGEPRRHANRHLVRLFACVAEVNGVKVDVAHNSTYVITYGYSDDIDAAEALWSRIAAQMIRFGEDYLATGAWQADTRIVRDRGGSRIAAMTRQTARATYYEAYITSLAPRLLAARDRTVAETDARPEAAAATSAAVALRRRDVAVADFYRGSSRARGAWRGNSTVVGLSASARDAGSRDAARTRIGEDAALPGPRAALP